MKSSKTKMTVLTRTDVSVRADDGSFVLVPKHTEVFHEYERRVTGGSVTHTVHRFRCSYGGRSLVHTTVCQGFDMPDWLI